MPFPVNCPGCGEPWQERPKLVGVRRRDWESLAFRCLSCGIGYSNATDPDARVRIVRAVHQAVPAEVHPALEQTLEQALNVRNRLSKRAAFCSFNSEDAATWTVFRGLQLTERLDRVAATLAPDHPQSASHELLLWGVPLGGAHAQYVHEQLVLVCDELGEAPQSRSEPDVVLSMDTVVTFVEAKTGSRNDLDREAGGWPTYLADEHRFRAAPAQVHANGRYELVRNWIIGDRLADKLGRDFRLINLGPSSLASDIDDLQTVLGVTAHRDVMHLRWATLLEAAGTLPVWLDDYVVAHGLRAM